MKLEARYPVVKTFRFAIAGALGFGVTEAVLTIGLLLIYGRLSVPHASFSSLELLSLDILSLVVGVSASFFINERITVNVQEVATEVEEQAGQVPEVPGRERGGEHGHRHRPAPSPVRACAFAPPGYDRGRGGHLSDRLLHLDQVRLEGTSRKIGTQVLVKSVASEFGKEDFAENVQDLGARRDWTRSWVRAGPRRS